MKLAARLGNHFLLAALLHGAVMAGCRRSPRSGDGDEPRTIPVANSRPPVSAKQTPSSIADLLPPLPANLSDEERDSLLAKARREGMAALGQGRWTDVLSAYGLAIQLLPGTERGLTSEEWVEFRCRLGEAHMSLGQWMPATRYLAIATQLLADDSASRTCHRLRGLLEERQDHAREAAYYYALAARSCEDKEASEGLGRVKGCPVAAVPVQGVPAADLAAVWALVRPTQKASSPDILRELGHPGCTPGCSIDPPGFDQVDGHWLLRAPGDRWIVFQYVSLRRTARCGGTSHEIASGVLRDHFSFVEPNLDGPPGTETCGDQTEGGWIERYAVPDPGHADRLYVIDHCGMLSKESVQRHQGAETLPLHVTPEGIFVDLPNCGNLVRFERT